MLTGASKYCSVFFLLALLGFVPSLYSAEEFPALIDRGLEAASQGNSAKAVKLLRKAQTLNPSAKEVAGYLESVREDVLDRDRTGRSALLRTVIQGEKLGTDEGKELATVARQILESATEVEKTLLRDTSQIQKVVEGLLEVREDHIRWAKEMTQAKHRYGRYLVPVLVQLLDHQEPGHRLMAYRALTHIGRDAVIPLLVALESPVARVRGQVASILGRIGAPLAASSLKFVAETDSDKVVRETALQALKRLNADTSLPARELLARDAERFIRKKNLLPRPNYEPYWWHLEGKKLAGEKVASFQVERRIADMLLRRSTAVAKMDLPSWALFVKNRAAQVKSYKENLALMKKEGADEAAISLLEGQAAHIHKLAQSIRTAGLDIMAAALKRALSAMDEFGGSPAAALYLTGEIRDYSPLAGRNVKAVSALKQALASYNLRVSFEAAIALAKLQPDLTEEAAQDMVATISGAVADPGARVALIISPDEDIRARFRGILNEAGFLPIVTSNVLQGLSEAVAFPPKHVVFLDRNVKELGVPQTINYLRNSKGGANTPVAVISMPEKEEESRNLYGSYEQVQIVPSIVKLQELEERILQPVVQNADDARSEGEEYAQQGAEALLGLLESSVPYSIAPAKESLSSAVADRHRVDEVRIPAAACLGYLGDKQTLRVLTGEIGADSKNSVPVRVACVQSIGEILLRLELGLDNVEEEVSNFTTVLRSCLKDSDEQIRVEAARAIGKAAWKPEVILSLGKAGK